jgi:hypothetical protein
MRLAEGTNRAVPKLKPSDELDWDAVIKALIGHFRSNDEASTAKEALARLVAAGCDEKEILQNLYAYCGGDPRAMQALRVAIDFGRCKKRMLAIAELLQKASSEIEPAEQLLTDLGLSHTMKPDVSSLEKYADLLRRVGKVAYRKLASKRISGRDQHLVYLARMIDALTGKPHYRELADLVNAMGLLYDPGTTKIETAESIRKRVSHYGLLDLVSEIDLIDMQRPHRPSKNRRT